MVAPGGMWDQVRKPQPFPWAMAIAARESLRAGNEHRSSGVGFSDLIDIARRYHDLYDPIDDDQDALALLVRTAYEQFPFQEPLFYGAARSRLLFERPTP